jgi:hypothetical protein
MSRSSRRSTSSTSPTSVSSAAPHTLRTRRRSAPPPACCTPSISSPAGGLVNLPTVLNAFGTLNSDNRIVITGIAVNPVADLGSFARVNGSFSFFTDKVGEVPAVSFTDTGGGFRLTSNNTLVRSGVLALPVADEVSPAMAPPGIQSDSGSPVTVGGFEFTLDQELAPGAVNQGAHRCRTRSGLLTDRRLRPRQGGLHGVVSRSVSTTFAKPVGF